MNKASAFPKLLSSFLTEYLPTLRNVSKHTILSYCDGIRLLLTFCKEQKTMAIERIEVKDLSSQLIKEYLNWLSVERNCSVSTKNQRLAAIHSFFRYILAESPQDIMICHKILQIPFAKTEKHTVNYLNVEEMQTILSKPRQDTPNGRRDLSLLCLLYDTGARVSEICGIKVRDVRLGAIDKVILYGKNRKFREVPLMTNTSQHIKAYIAEQHLDTPEKLEHPVFFNRQRKHLTRVGVDYVVQKYAAEANIDIKISPHIFRHSKAMHLLNSGINIFYIKGLLGHEDISTTEIYAKATIETQKAALEKYSVAIPNSMPSWAKDNDTLSWLKSLGKD